MQIGRFFGIPALPLVSNGFPLNHERSSTAGHVQSGVGAFQTFLSHRSLLTKLILLSQTRRKGGTMHNRQQTNKDKTSYPPLSKLMNQQSSQLPNIRTYQIQHRSNVGADTSLNHHRSTHKAQ